jgi:hypothetical protein
MTAIGNTAHTLSVIGESSASSCTLLGSDRFACGPVEGSIGFTRGRGSRLRGYVAPGGVAGPSSNSRVDRSSTADFRLDLSSASSSREATDQLRSRSSIGGNGGGGAVCADAADEHMDRLDPDFDRNYNKWNPHPVPPPRALVHPLYAASNASYERHQQQQAFQMHQQQLYHQVLRSQGTGPCSPGQAFDPPRNNIASVQGVLYHHHTVSGGGRGGGGGGSDGGFMHQHQSQEVLRPFAPLAQCPPIPQQYQLQHHDFCHQHLPRHGFGSIPSIRPPGPLPQAALQLPSHTGIAPGLQEHGEPVEPHVARSNGILRPAHTALTENPLIRPKPPMYGLDSLADFPSLADRRRK